MRRRFHHVVVGAETGGGVAACSERQSLAACRAVFDAPVPGLEGGILERSAVGETDRPGLGSSEIADRVQMRRRQALILAARQEDDSGNSGGHMTPQRAQGG